VNGLADLGWALLSLLGAACFLAMVIAEHAEIGRRLRQAGRILAACGPCFVAAVLTWSCRGRSPGPAHPAAKAIQGCPGCDACTADLSPVAFAEWEREVRAGRTS
jgi:hypothetical protein